MAGLFQWVSDGRDPAFHGAVEDVLLREAEGAWLLFYRNDRSVHCGKNQVVWAEVDPTFVHPREVPVFRRVSGGGTVFHDPGNLCFALVCPSRCPVGFSWIMPLLARAVRRLGIAVEVTDTSDLVGGGLKLSGNAESASRGRLLHHGTLLIDSDLDALRGALRRSGRYAHRGIASRPRPVANLRDLAAQEPAGLFAAARDAIATELAAEFGPVTTRPLPEALLPSIGKRRLELASPAWRWGRSPDYRFENPAFPGGGLRLNVARGRITSVEGRAGGAFDRLTGLDHEPGALIDRPGCGPKGIDILDTLF